MITQQAQDKLKHWREWLDGDLFEYMNKMLYQREVFRSWNEIVGEASYPPNVSGLFNVWVNVNYLDSLSVTIRALCDRRTDTTSLWRFLMDMKKHHTLLSREWWENTWRPSDHATRTLFPDDYRRHLERFEKMSNGNPYIDRTYIQKYIDELNELSKNVKGHVDLSVAHTSKHRESKRPKLPIGEIHSAADGIYDIFRHWYQLIN